METLFAAAAGSFMIMLLVVLTIAMRRGSRIQELMSELSDQKKKMGESEARYKDKCRQTDDVLTKLAQSRDETSKVKRKAYILEQQEKRQISREEDDTSQLYQQALEKAQTQARQYLEELDQLRDERDQAQGQIKRLKSNLAEAKSSLQAQGGAAESDRRKLLERSKQLEISTQAFEKKLQSARRKARIGSQVYKVTNNKLELAMDKIAYLESRVKSESDAETQKDALSMQDRKALSKSGATDPQDQMAVAQEDEAEIGD